MKPTAAQLEKVQEILSTTEQWLRNYQAHKLSDVPEMTAALPLVNDAYKKAKVIIGKYPTAAALGAPAKETKSSLNPLKLWDDLQAKWANSQLISAITGGFTLENAPNIITEAGDFISLAETVSGLVGKIPGMGSISKTVQEWLAKARTALSKAQTGLQLLNTFKGLSGSFDKFKGLLDGKLKLDGKFTQEVKGFIASAGQLLTGLKQIPGDTDKVGATQKWIDSLSEVLSKAGGVVDAALEDKDGNGLPDWYDKIKASITDYTSLTSLIPGINIDDKMLAKAREIQAEIEKWLSVATKFGKKFQNLVKDLQGSLAQVKKFIGGMAKFADAVKNGDWKSVYDQVKAAWRDLDKLTGFIPGTDLDEKAIAKAQALKASLEGFLTKFTGMGGDIFDKIEEVKQMVSKVTSFIDEGKKFVDALKNGDWGTVFESLKTAYTNIDKLTGFIPGTDIDDKAIAKVQELKKKLEDFLTKTTGMGGNLLDKIEEVKKMVEKTKGYIDEGKKFIDAIKNGDWKTVYNSIKEGYNNIDKLTGFLPFTDADDKIIAQVQALKAGMENFLKQKLGGNGDIFQAIEEIKGLYGKVNSFASGLKKFADDVKSGNWTAVFDQIKSAWTSLDGKIDLVKFTNIDDKLIAKVQGIKKMVDDFLTKTTGVSGLENQIAQVKGWVGTIQKVIDFGKGIVTDIQNGDYKSLFNKIVKAWSDLGNLDDIFKGTKIEDGFLAKIQGVQKDIEAFISKATGGVLSGDLAAMVKQVEEYKKRVEGAIGFVKALTGDIQNKDFGAAIKRVLGAWGDLSKMSGGFIAGTNLDEKLIKKSGEVKKIIEDFITKYSGGALSGDLLNMFNQVLDYKKQLEGFIDEVTGLWEDIQSGNWSLVYERLKKGVEEIEKRKGDIIPGTSIDEVLYQKAKALKEQGILFLADLLKRGTQDERIAQIQSWIGDVGGIIDLFFSKKPIIDKSELYAKDDIVIEVPELEQLDNAQQDKLLAELGATKGGIREKLKVALSSITKETTQIHKDIDAAYVEALQRNIDSVGPVKDAKAYFEGVAAEQKRIIEIIKKITNLVIDVVTVALLPTGAGPLVGAALKFVTGAGSLTDVVSQIKTGNPIADAAIQLGGGLLSSAFTKPNMGVLVEVGGAELKNMFDKLVTEKYLYIKQHVTDAHNKIHEAADGFVQVPDAELAKIQANVLALVQQWKSIYGQIKDKYLSPKSTRVDVKKAYMQSLRMLYCGWLANNKDITLIDRIIDDLNSDSKTGNIAGNAGVKLSKGAGAKIARGLGQIFGSWLSFGEGKKIKQLATFGMKEAALLSVPAKWKGVL